MLTEARLFRIAEELFISRHRQHTLRRKSLRAVLIGTLRADDAQDRCRAPRCPGRVRSFRIGSDDDAPKSIVRSASVDWVDGLLSAILAQPSD